MSRIGKKPIPVPKGVTVSVQDGAVEVKGPKGAFAPARAARHHVRGQGRRAHRRDAAADAELSKFHGLARSLMANAVQGVTEGFKERAGHRRRGYRAEVKGKQAVFALGYSHPVVLEIPPGIEVTIDKQTHITVTGIDRQLVGQIAANIRRMRKPDPYKQKGVRYMGEVLKKKVGKTGA